MPKYEFKSEHSSTFAGREPELRWLDDRLLRRDYAFRPLIISGPPGVGKTALIQQWLTSRRITNTPIWLDLSSEPDIKSSFDHFAEYVSKLNEEGFPSGDRIIVVIDGSDPWSEKQHAEASDKIFNHKMVSSLVFTRDKSITVNRSENLHLEALTHNAAASLIRMLLQQNIDEEEIGKIINASKGFPLAISLLTDLLKAGKRDTITSLLQKPIYDLSNGILLPNNEIIKAAPPILASANHKLIASLQKQPGDLYKLNSWEFEKLLAELLSDMGWEVELTKRTRDGGADILAYLNTGIGRLLCLVEAKHYRQDRKIGVDLVRTLYGTLCDAQANSAMMVTSSTFTKDSKEFQQKHQYQLTLRDYADIVTWLLKYGKTQKNHKIDSIK